ncbi:MAG: hypothetical protein LBG59_02675 [Candidatus Peribacteria bacterium]|jgi:hypothetical protein|nr:hypothetical protein [Candidatus Peribacteria bacterium]
MIQPLKVNLSSKIPVIQVHNLAGELMFNITLPTKEVVTVLAPNYTITPLQGESFGIFNGGKVIHRNGENLLFIAPNGQIYTEKNLIGTYRYNPDQQTISYLLKESALSPITDTIEVTIKVQPFQK